MSYVFVRPQFNINCNVDSMFHELNKPQCLVSKHTPDTTSKDCKKTSAFKLDE